MQPPTSEPPTPTPPSALRPHRCRPMDSVAALLCAPVPTPPFGTLTWAASFCGAARRCPPERPSHTACMGRLWEKRRAGSSSTRRRSTLCTTSSSTRSARGAPSTPTATRSWCPISSATACRTRPRSTWPPPPPAARACRSLCCSSRHQPSSPLPTTSPPRRRCCGRRWASGATRRIRWRSSTATRWERCRRTSGPWPSRRVCGPSPLYVAPHGAVSSTMSSYGRSRRRSKRTARGTMPPAASATGRREASRPSHPSTLDGASARPGIRRVPSRRRGMHQPRSSSAARTCPPLQAATATTSSLRSTPGASPTWRLIPAVTSPAHWRACGPACC